MMTSILPARPTIHLLSLENFAIFDQLKLEEALLRIDHRNWCILNRGSPPAIVMGISGRQEKLIDHAQLKENPVPIIRRFTGGGTVFIDKNTLFATWICNTSHVDVSCCPQKIHQRMASFYQQAFPLLKMDLRENDYVIGERKWGGNAQYLCKGRWLHHTSMLWDYELENMNYLLMPVKIPLYRQSRNHADFLCCLQDYFSDSEQIKINIVNTLHEKFHVIEVSFEEITEVLEKPHRKATTLL